MLGGRFRLTDKKCLQHAKSLILTAGSCRSTCNIAFPCVDHEVGSTGSHLDLAFLAWLSLARGIVAQAILTAKFLDDCSKCLRNVSKVFGIVETATSFLSQRLQIGLARAVFLDHSRSHAFSDFSIPDPTQALGKLWESVVTNWIDNHV